MLGRSVKGQSVHSHINTQCNTPTSYCSPSLLWQQEAHFSAPPCASLFGFAVMCPLHIYWWVLPHTYTSHIRPYTKCQIKLKDNIFFCFFFEDLKINQFLLKYLYALLTWENPTSVFHCKTSHQTWLWRIWILLFVFSHPCQNVFLFPGKHKLKGTQTHLHQAALIPQPITMRELRVSI